MHKLEDPARKKTCVYLSEPNQSDPSMEIRSDKREGEKKEL